MSLPQYVLQIGASLCYKLGQLYFITNWGRCYKLGQLFQIGAQQEKCSVNKGCQ